MNKGEKYYLKIVTLLVCIFSLTSCGFKPIYKTQSNPMNIFLQSIEIIPISSPDGADYYNHLKNILPPAQTPKHHLETTLLYGKDYSIIQRNSDVLREVVTIKISYKLLESQTQKLVTSGHFTRLASYSTNFSPYSNQTNQQEIQKLLAIMSAEEVRNRIILFFENSEK